MNSVSTPPMIQPELSFAELAENFALLGEWDDRYSYIIDLGRKLPAFPAALQTDAYKVRGCMSQVWMVPGHPEGHPEQFAFTVDRQRPDCGAGGFVFGQNNGRDRRHRCGSIVPHPRARSTHQPEPA